MRTSGEWRKWRLLAKLDPDKENTKEILKIICHSNVDAVVVGGTQGITWDNTWNLVRLVRENGFERPVVQEISSEDAVVPGVDAYFLPVVLNAGDKKWLVDSHLKAIQTFGSFIPWDNVLTEGYLVCNGNSAVGQLTRSKDITAREAAAYVILAEKVYGIPLFYMEYSGAYGDLDVLKAVVQARETIHIVYGGGIKTVSQCRAVAEWADTVVIGNVLYENPSQAREILCSMGGRDSEDR